MTLDAQRKRGKKEPVTRFTGFRILTETGLFFFFLFFSWMQVHTIVAQRTRIGFIWVRGT